MSRSNSNSDPRTLVSDFVVEWL